MWHFLHVIPLETHKEAKHACIAGSHNLRIQTLKLTECGQPSDDLSPRQVVVP